MFKEILIPRSLRRWQSDALNTPVVSIAIVSDIMGTEANELLHLEGS